NNFFFMGSSSDQSSEAMQKKVRPGQGEPNGIGLVLWPLYRVTWSNWKRFRESLRCGQTCIARGTKRGTSMTRPATTAISPFFIVSNVDRTIAFYRDKLGFETTFQEPQRNPFFAIVRRDGAQLLVKSDGNVAPLPNPKRHPSMRWDAFVYAPDPDALATE